MNTENTTMTQAQQPEALRFTKTATIVASQWFKSGDHPAVRDISDSDDLFFTGMGGATLVEREKFGVIGTLESPNHLVTPGDWIITGVKGEHYPCKPDIFEATYTPETKLEAQLSAIGAGGVEPLRKQAATQAAHPENIREGAPYDNPEFEQLARDMGVWGTPQAALCAQFWLAATPAADAPLVPQGWKPVQIELLERIQESLGSFLSDQGWSQSDMDTADALGGLLAAAPQPPACNLSLQPELAT